MRECTVSTEYERRGIDTVLLENDRLRVEILAGKGGDITEIRDKRTDTNILFEAPHEWRAPDDGTVEAPDPVHAFLDHYPGGWQNVTPNAGGPASVNGASLPQHGGSALTPWDVSVERDAPEQVSISLTTELTRYPLALERQISLNRDESALDIEDGMQNLGEVPVSYAWLQHIVFGPPLVGSDATVEVPCETVLVDPDHTDPNARLEPGTTGTWPTIAGADGDTVDLSTLPPKANRVHDLAALTDLARGTYEVRNPTLDLAVSVSFPPEFYEYVWYWGAFGGFESAPFYGRNYNLGLEPCTSVPNAGLERAISEGTANRIGPSETVTANVRIETGPAEE